MASKTSTRPAKGKAPKVGPAGSPSGSGFGMVLGAGGLVGMAYHVGVLEALADVGVTANDADIIVGTSAGAAIGAEVRTGRPLAEIRNRALSEPGTSEGNAPTDIFTRAWESPFELGQRVVGSAYVVGRSFVRLPGPRMPQALRRVFPAGLMSPDLEPGALDDLLPTEWPEKPLWLCAVDIATGRRVVLGRPGSIGADLREAVVASCAIPALYQPVRVSGTTLVDGGMHSSTNLELAAEFGSKLIICIAPMAYDRRDTPGLAQRLARRRFDHAIEREVLLARASGASVLLFRPSVAELALHGFNPMRKSGNDVVADAARRAARRRLSSERFKRLLRQFELV